MASLERNISGVSRGTSSVEARLTGLEQEAARLRAEVAALQDEIRWLTGEDDDDDRGLRSHGWLSRGWARASMLMAVVGLVAFVSIPYVLHMFDASPSQAAQSAAPGRPAEAVVRPATIAPKAAASEYIPIPARVRSSDIPAPAYVPKRATAATRGEPR
jgi:hypothetical protein